MLQKMGRKWGKVVRDLRHIAVYRISPYEQRVFAGFFTEGAPNLVRRFFDQVFYILPGFVGFVGIYYWMEKSHYEANRKNPKDYENEE